MARLWLALAALNGLIAVAAGAYAAHGFGGTATGLRLMDTATLYQLAHALALLAVAWLAAASPGPFAQVAAMAAGLLFTAGIALFSGSLYALAFGRLPVSGAAPTGGIMLIAGWIALFIRALAGPLHPR